jgi:chemotaxis protein methyltransferase CheR
VSTQTIETVAVASSDVDAAGLCESDFRRLRDFLHVRTGIDLRPEKQTQVANRLQSRLRALALSSYQEYVDLILQAGNEVELQSAIDLLTTNETYFFREPEHFAFLKRTIASSDHPERRWRIWSAACSSGEEPYSIAMVLADLLGPDRGVVVASDISQRVLRRAQRGHYPLARVEHLPLDYLHRFCLKGVGPEAGSFLIDKPLRKTVSFRTVNLVDRLPALGQFDAVFLRNALIYFNRADRRSILHRVVQTLAPGGHLFIGHAESLQGTIEGLEPVQPSVFRRTGARAD